MIPGILARVLLPGALLAAPIGPIAPAAVMPAPARLAPAVAVSPSDSAFAATVARLSEPGGFFDSDNLVSNEASYLHVLGRLTAIGTRGGAYLGVGPDQNFSYIAHIRPRIALIVDIRRDNMLQQLMYKAVFALAPTRAEFVATLFGRPSPARPARFAGATPEALMDWVDSTSADSATAAAARRRVLETARGFGVPLDARDVATIERFHGEFITHGGQLRYTSLGRPSRAFYPSYRQLVAERDLDSRQASYLATEETYRWLRDFQGRGLVVPVVGNLAGGRAMPEIARFLRERGDSLSAIYASNAEQYIMRDGAFPAWAANLLHLPRTERSVVIRSFFGRNWAASHPYNQAGYFSTQLVQRVDTFAREWEKRTITDYWSLVTVGAEEP